jgi:hypothetical protein
MLPPPVLRREGKNFATIIQDLVGNSICESSGFNLAIPTESEEIVQNLFFEEEMIKNEFFKESQMKNLIKNRWTIRGFLGEKKIWIVCRIAKVLRGCFKAHCRVTFEKLEGIEDLIELISEYCLRVFDR